MTTPKHNRWDNIWQIRRRGYPTEEQLREAISEPSRLTDTRRIGRALIFDDVHHFIYTVVHSSRISLPIWKLLIPRLDNHNVGAIYYIVKTAKGNFIFRAT